MITFFEGPAGTGKTFSLIAAVREKVASGALHNHENILALTFMHGSRRRLASKLESVPELRGRYECSTIDSFAWGLVGRWRSLAASLGFAYVTLDEANYDQTCEIAARLMEQECVSKWVRRKFPILVVDEMQDCHHHRLSLIQAAGRVIDCFAAADDFQDLGNDGGGESAAVQWLKADGQTTTLDTNHRTGVQELLDAALAVRSGQPVLSSGAFRVFDVYRHHVAASHMACNFFWYGRENPVLLSPNRPSTSTLVRQTCDRLESKSIAPKPLKGTSVGPFYIRWETDTENSERAILQELGFAGDEQPEGEMQSEAIGHGSPAASFVQRRIQRYCRLNHVNTVPASVVSKYARQGVHALRAYGSQPETKCGTIRAMTVHQAKNREFESVILLWPYEVGGSLERQRRLLYNAITRAKRRVTVLVQSKSPHDRRSAAAPFNIA